MTNIGIVTYGALYAVYSYTSLKNIASGLTYEEATFLVDKIKNLR